MSEKQMRLGALEAGGTKMVCAVVSGDGEVLDRMETPTLTPAETVPQMVEWFTVRDVDALGIGAFGPTCVDPNDERYGSILQTPKLAWRGHGLRAAFADALGIPVAYDTDVNVACLGEVVFGCCKGLEDAVYVTIGTGVGAGVMCAGRLLHGMLHPEAGHMLVRTRPTEEGRCVCRATRAVSRASPPAPPSPRAGESPRPSSRTTLRCGRSRGIIWGRCARTSCSCTRLAVSSSAAA